MMRSFSFAHFTTMGSASALASAMECVFWISAGMPGGAAISLSTEMLMSSGWTTVVCLVRRRTTSHGHIALSLPNRADPVELEEIIGAGALLLVLDEHAADVESADSVAIRLGAIELRHAAAAGARRDIDRDDVDP